ncbi:non-heme iron oxygenase ferredoxin subunit [soil metagenome]
MSSWINVANVNDFPEGSWRCLPTAHESILVFNYQGQYYAIANVCTHDGSPLTGGHVEGCEIICPRHGARFDIRTGAVTAPPAYEDVPTYSVRIEKGVIQVSI